MTAIQDHEPPGEGDGALEMGAAAMSVATAAVAAASQAVRSVTTQLAAQQTTPEWEVAGRLAALRSGNNTERELARFITRCLDVAEGTRPRASEDDTPSEDGTPSDHNRDGTGSSGAEATTAPGQTTADPSQATAGRSADEITDESAPGGYSTALSGVDAFETILSAAEAGKARVVTDAYVHAREALVEPTLSPGQRVKHTDGRIDTVLSSTQITGADLSVIVNQSPGLAKVNVTRAVNLVQHMPHTLARLEAGELSGYQQRLIVDEALPMPPALIEQLDELVCGRPFTGRHAGTGDHRAAMSVFRRRLNKAVEAIGFEPPAKKTRRSGFAGRYVRFGLTGADGMTSLHGCVPSLHAKAIDTLLEDLARLTHNKADERTVEQRRVDAFLTCFTGPAALSPAGQLALDVSAASFDEDGQYVVVDEQQNLEAQSIWATIQLLAASLGLTFPDVPTATVTVDVDLDTLTDPPCNHGPYDHAAPPSSTHDPADATARTGATRGADGTGTTAETNATRGADGTGSTGVDEAGPPPTGPAEASCPSSGAAGEPSCGPVATQRPGNQHHGGQSGGEAHQPGRPAQLWALAPPERGSTPRTECRYTRAGSAAEPESLSARAADAYWLAQANDAGMQRVARVLEQLQARVVSTARTEHGTTRAAHAVPASDSIDTDTCCDPLLHDASPEGARARHRAATVRGVGDIPDSLARRLMRFAALQRVITDPLTGQPLEVGRRHPDTKLRTTILNRDRHCRFPGCARTAALDLDHIAPYRDDAPAAVSQTVPQNLQALCREHHRVKHQLHWTPEMQPDGTIQWRNNLLDLTATS